MRTSGRKPLFVALCVVALAALSAAPAAAQSADSAAASAFGGHLTGPVEIGPEPTVSAEVPPGESDEDALIEIPAEPLLESGTFTVEAQSADQAQYEAVLQAVIDAFGQAPEASNSRGYAATENAVALDGNLTADVLEAEALASCVDGQLNVATGARIANATLAGQELPVGELVEAIPITSEAPNHSVAPEVLGPLGVEIVTWDTNWDGQSGTTDGSDTVYVNALRVSVSEESPLAPALGGPQDLILSHAEATANCDAGAGPLGPETALSGVTKAASQDVVAPGDTFDYTITAPNAAVDCTLNPVRVEDRIDGPTGSQVVATSPQADSVNGLDVVWDNIGPIAPGDTVVLTISVSVPDDAPNGATYREDLRVTGECDGTPVERDIAFDGPRVQADTGPQGPPAPVDSSPSLPRTGGPFALGGLALLGMGAGVRWLRG